jgi:hypothetical protein
MRTIEEIYNRDLQLLLAALKRPRLYGGSAGGIRFLLRRLLDDLLFIDNRETDWQDIAGRYLMGCADVYGQLDFQHLPFPDYVNEVASTYAEVAFALGYFTPERLLSEEEMDRLNSAMTDEFMERDWNETELYDRFGTPSHTPLGGVTTVACYACSRRDMKWVFFDLSRGRSGAEDSLAAPLVRDVRKDFGNKMCLLPFGKQLAGEGSVSRGSEM